MQEYKKLRQEQNGYRRLFYDDLFDLYVWYTGESPRIIGFQIVYTSGDSQKALTWTEKEGFSHTGIDEGDRTLINQSPVLVQDGVFQYDFVTAELPDRMGNLDEEIQELVLSKIENYKREGM